MKKIYISIGLLTVLFVYYCKSDTFSLNGTDSQYPGMCVYDGVPYPPGEHKVNRRCVKIICGNNGWISGHTCVKYNKSDCGNGELFGFSKPFPECCKRIYTCIDDKGDQYKIIDF